MYHSFSIYLSTDGHLGCFQIWAIVNNMVMNIWVHIFFRISVSGFSVYIPRSEIAGPISAFRVHMIYKWYGPNTFKNT